MNSLNHYHLEQAQRMMKPALSVFIRKSTLTVKRNDFNFLIDGVLIYLFHIVKFRLRHIDPVQFFNRAKGLNIMIPPSAISPLSSIL